MSVRKTCSCDACLPGSGSCTNRPLTLQSRFILSISSSSSSWDTELGLTTVSLEIPGAHIQIIQVHNWGHVHVHLQMCGSIQQILFPIKTCPSMCMGIYMFMHVIQCSGMRAMLMSDPGCWRLGSCS